MYVLQILDNFNSGFPMLSVAILECLTFAWFYGKQLFVLLITSDREWILYTNRVWAWQLLELQLLRVRYSYSENNFHICQMIPLRIEYKFTNIKSEFCLINKIEVKII